MSKSQKKNKNYIFLKFAQSMISRLCFFVLIQKEPYYGSLKSKQNHASRFCMGLSRFHPIAGYSIFSLYKFYSVKKRYTAILKYMKNMNQSVIYAVKHVLVMRSATNHRDSCRRECDSR